MVDTCQSPSRLVEGSKSLDPVVRTTRLPWIKAMIPKEVEEKELLFGLGIFLLLFWGGFLFVLALLGCLVRFFLKNEFILQLYLYPSKTEGRKKKCVRKCKNSSHRSKPP